MGIAWLLLIRTFHNRPKRTLLFLLGYALATTVMITLLSVGEAVLKQARDKDLLGGGDLIIVPQGIDLESMKMGGITALYYSIPQGRFLLRQLLQSSRFASEIEDVSPYIFSRLLYARKPGSSQTETVFGQGSLPDEENRIKRTNAPWRNTAEDTQWLHAGGPQFYHDIDHFHLPSVTGADLRRWAEWHYFNFESPDFYGYLSIMVAGDITRDQAEWIVSLQMVSPEYKRYAASYPATREQLPLRRISYRVGQNFIRFDNDHYEIDLDFHDHVPIKGVLKYFPQPNLYFPPTDLARTNHFESGYVIPAIRGRYEGSLVIGKKEYRFDGASGYHDHNWGIWQKIVWNWGHLYSDKYAIFYGEIFLEGRSKGLFVGILDNNGFLTVLRPEKIEFSDYRKQPGGLSVPMQWRIQAKKRFVSLMLTGKATSLLSTKVEGIDSLYFIQYKAAFHVQAALDDRRLTFDATGNAETFVPPANGAPASSLH